MLQFVCKLITTSLSHIHTYRYVCVVSFATNTHRWFASARGRSVGVVVVQNGLCADRCARHTRRVWSHVATDLYATQIETVRRRRRRQQRFRQVRHIACDRWARKMVRLILYDCFCFCVRQEVNVIMVVVVYRYHVAGGVKFDAQNKAYQLGLHVNVAPLPTTTSTVADPSNFALLDLQTLDIGRGFVGTIDQVNILDLKPDFCAAMAKQDDCYISQASLYETELHTLLRELRTVRCIFVFSFCFVAHPCSFNNNADHHTSQSSIGVVFGAFRHGHVARRVLWRAVGAWRAERQCGAGAHQQHSCHTRWVVSRVVVAS